MNLRERLVRSPYRSSLLTILVGLSLFFIARNLPPDLSLQRVQNNKVLSVCHPPKLPPFVTSEGGWVNGSEAELLRLLAHTLMVDTQFNLQAGWGQGSDPTDWGLRPEACDVVIGGILVAPETQALLSLLPYRQTHWALLGDGPKIAVVAPFWGAEPGALGAWVEKRYRLSFVGDLFEALNELRSGQITGVLTLWDAAMWLRQQGAKGEIRPIFTLGEPRLAIGVWKGRTTLKRAMELALIRLR